jgi:hypothetical protein
MGKHLKRLVVVLELKKEVRLNGLKFHSEYLDFINEHLKQLVATHSAAAKSQGAKLLDPKFLKENEVKKVEETPTNGN